MDEGGNSDVDDGGRQNSSNRSASREDWRCRYVAEESRDCGGAR